MHTLLKQNKCVLLINHTILCDIIHHIWEIKQSFTSVNDGEVIKINIQCNFLKFKWYDAVWSCIIMIKNAEDYIANTIKQLTLLNLVFLSHFIRRMLRNLLHANLMLKLWNRLNM